MLTVFFIVISVAMVGIVLPLLGMFTEENYGRTLENYIMRHNPQNAGDIERLTVQFHRDQERNFI